MLTLQEVVGDDPEEEEPLGEEDASDAPAGASRKATVRASGSGTKVHADDGILNCLCCHADKAGVSLVLQD